MKYFLMVMVLISSFQAMAQVDPEVKPPVNEVPEDTMLYTRVGRSIGSFPEAQSITMNSLGVLRYAENFIYGVEYNTFYSSNNSNRMMDIQAILGYRVIWNKRFLPYAMLEAGPASYKNDNDASLPHGDGIAFTVDAGVDVVKYWKVKVSVGIRNTWGTYSTKEMSTTSFTDIYSMVGIVF